MIVLLKKYWVEILVFAGVLTILLCDVANGITWMNTDSDGAHYILAAKYMLPAHNTSAPLFLLLGRLFLFLPFGTEAWRMGLISILSTTGGTFLIYLIVRRILFGNKLARWCAIVASLVYGGSALVISQSTIIETYALSTALLLLAYYLSLKRKWVAVSIAIGLIWAVHTLFAWIVWAVLLVQHREMRNWVMAVITLSFLAFYLYIPISAAVNGDLRMWGNTTFGDFIRANLGVFLMLTGGLSIWDFPKRLFDTVGILGISLGLGLPILAYYFFKMKKWRNGLLWLFLIPVLWFSTNLSAETYVYLMPSVAFGSVAVGLGLGRMNKRWIYATAVVAIGLACLNANYFDLGRTLDPEMSAMKFYKEELPKIPDGEYFMGGGWTWAMVYLYNREEGRNIIPISTDIFPSDKYLTMLEDEGVKLVRSEAESQITLQGEIALSIAELNDGVWIAKETKPEVYQYVIEPVKGNEGYIGRWIGQEVQPEWKWKPSNPYKYISGKLEVAEWHHVLMSNRNMLRVAVYGMIGYGAWWLVARRLRKRKENKSEELYND